MSRKDFLFTSESVTEGHPDKIADQISDAVLDAVISQDPNSRVACETMVTTGMVVIAGEITTKAIIDIPKTARETIREIGYTRAKYGFDCETCAVLTSIDKQSPDIAQGVDASDAKPQGAGDQGLMFGYACDETPELMPMPISLAHKLALKLSEMRKNNVLNYLRPDGKTQVTVEYVDGMPARIDTVIVSSQHGPDITPKEMKADIIEKIIKPVMPKGLFNENDATIYINPTGRFVVGGPMGDCGLTGRKIIVDTYGGVGSHGGGAFSGKGPSKVDRSASYMARHIAKNIVASGVAKKCEVQLAYAIGIAEPVSIMIDTFNTGKISLAELRKIVRDTFDLTPSGIIKYLDLKRPIYKKTAAYGHFGRNEPEFTWEKINKAEEIRKAAGF
ncbi:MAG: methionine adenosyltransferase [Candidatus Schekmanbacteria bacterium RIFCSPHIGHO2_02_FULL_38_11]|nr:MAG: methionine adenosyltransferase [Candidatus Schekmanbacteria bacterium RIFCSPHIGHO2_02_FULL_38_11]